MICLDNQATSPWLFFGYVKIIWQIKNKIYNFTNQKKFIF